MGSPVVRMGLVVFIIVVACTGGIWGFDFDKPNHCPLGVSSIGHLGQKCEGACGADGIARCQGSGSILPPRIKQAECTCKDTVTTLGNAHVTCKRKEPGHFDCGQNPAIKITSNNHDAKGNGD